MAAVTQPRRSEVSKKSKQFRQGDVFVAPCAEIPKDAVVVTRDAGRVVLAYGEVTGHCHAICEPDVALLEREVTVNGKQEKQLFLRVDSPKGAALTHQEHKTANIPPGTYSVTRQREYARGEVRQVLD
jgi:hypothetical protein